MAFIEILRMFLLRGIVYILDRLYGGTLLLVHNSSILQHPKQTGHEVSKLSLCSHVSPQPW